MILAADSKATLQYEHNLKTIDRRHCYSEGFKVFSDKKGTWTPSFEVSHGSRSVSYQPGLKYNDSISK